jgi:hypothetical protein
MAQPGRAGKGAVRAPLLALGLPGFQTCKVSGLSIEVIPHARLKEIRR